MTVETDDTTFATHSLEFLIDHIVGCLGKAPVFVKHQGCDIVSNHIADKELAMTG